MRDITLRDSAIYSNRLPTVPFDFEKLVRRIKYLISWQRHYLTRPFWNCLAHWSTIFLIYILTGRTNTKWWSTPRPQAPCYHYDCGGELEIILTSIMMYSEKTARYAYTTWVGNWHYAFGAVFFQNGSIYERECPWRLIGARGPVNQMWSGGCPS